jgi:hypothetical protein
MTLNPLKIKPASEESSVKLYLGRIHQETKTALTIAGGTLLTAGALALAIGLNGLAGIAAVGLAVGIKVGLVAGGASSFSLGSVLTKLKQSQSYLKLVADYDHPRSTDSYGIGFINGIRNRESNDAIIQTLIPHIESAQKRVKFYHVYNASRGAFLDIIDCLASKFGVETPPVQLLHQQWDNFFDSNPEGQFLQVCHSQGSQHAYNALKSYNKKRVKRITILAIAPAKTIPQSLCKKSLNVRSEKDFLPLVSANREELIVKKAHSAARKFDHAFLSPTYSDIIQSSIETFLA